MDKITGETTVSPSELAAVLGVTGRRVYQLAEDGIISRAARGRFNLADSVQKYAAYRTDHAGDDKLLSLSLARRKADAQLKISKAAVAKLQADNLKSTMYRAETVAAATEDLISTIHDALDSLPGRLAVDVAAAQTPAEALEIIRKGVHKVMRELAAYQYDPKEYDECARERRDWSERDDDAE